KSMGNVIAPQKVTNEMGADILRLWVASTDYSGELSISDTILKRVVEAYRRIRNSMTFLLGNLSDFDSAKDSLPTHGLLELDRYALALTASLQRDVLAHYADYSFHPAMARLTSFFSEDLGAFYLDILKDRLYTTKADGKARRSAQTALFRMTDALVRLMAPVLSFTAHEAWTTLHPKAETLFAQMAADLSDCEDAELLTRWQQIREVRAEVMRAIETRREAGEIGASLQAEVQIHAPAQTAELLASLQAELRFVMMTSAAEVQAHDTDQIEVSVAPSTHQKCGRCWHFSPSVGQQASHPTLCARCVTNLDGQGEDRAYA
ncbi:MAG: class I tRNA ligase family protein, partial [Burkholderiaceae bacterium]